MSAHITHRIAYRLAATVFVCALLAGELMALLITARDYWNARISMEEEISQMMGNTRGASAEALRRIDRKAGQQIVRGFMNLNSVYSATLVDNFGLPLASQERSLSTGEADWIFQTFAEGKRHFLLPIFTEGRIEPVGSVQVSVDTHYIYGDAIRRGKLLIFGAFVTALLIGAATHWVTHRRIGRNLDHLRGYVRAAAMGEMPPEAVQLPEPGAGRELDTLASAINDFTLSLRQQIAEAEWKTRRARNDLLQAVVEPRAPAPGREIGEPDDLDRLDHGLRLDAATRVLLGGADPEGAAVLLSALALPAADPPGQCDADEVAAAAMSFIAPLLGHSIRLQTTRSGTPLHAPVSREALTRWILRCAALGRSDMPLGGTLTLETGLVASPAGHHGPHVRITVGDTGAGSVSGTLSGPKTENRRPLRERITGALATAGGGFFQIQSAEELGTRVHLLLPAEKPQPAWTAPDGTVALVVHRDPSVIKAVAMHLRAAGLVVLEAPSATTAVERAMDSLAPVNLLLIEDPLPEASAAQVVEYLRAHVRDLRVIALRDHDGSGSTLPCPFGPVTLLTAVRHALDHPSPPG